jgi:hypothetical protein
VAAERREQAIAIRFGSTGNGRNLIIDGRRQPSCDGTSRMNREVQVRICERLGVKFRVELGIRYRNGCPHLPAADIEGSARYNGPRGPIVGSEGGDLEDKP